MAGNKERALAAAKKLIEMDEKYKMFSEKDTVEEEDLMALEADEQWISSDDEDVEKQRVKVPIVVKKRKRVQTRAMEVDE